VPHVEHIGFQYVTHALVVRRAGYHIAIRPDGQQAVAGATPLVAESVHYRVEQAHGSGRIPHELYVVFLALGDDVDLMIEWNFRLPNAKTAISAIKKVERYELAWVEEPIPLGDIDGYAEIRAAVETPISGGELLTSRYLFKERIDRGAYDIVQPDCCRMGISEAWKVAFLASLKGLPCVPHNWSGNGLNTAAQLNLLAAIPNHWYLESNESYYGTCPTFKKLLFDGSPVPKKGYFYVPKRPGLGVELNKEVATECAYIDGPSTAPI